MSPLASTTTGNDEILRVTQDSMAAGTADGKLIPRVATAWESSADAKTITITIGDQKWSDGTPMTTDDVLFTLNTYANPAVKAPLGSQLAPIAGYDAVANGSAKTLSGVTKVGTNQVKIELKAPDSGFMYLLMSAYYYILPEHTLKDVDPSKLRDSDIWAKPGAAPGLGPFVMTANLPGQRVEFKRNPYFRQPVQFETLVESLVTQDVATQQLSSGEMDLTLVQPTDLTSVQSLPGVTIYKNASPGYDRYTVNIHKPYLQNKLVRQAFLTAIDRAGIVSSIYGGLATVDNTSFLANGIDATALDPYTYDPAKAKQLLQQAGWDASQTIQINEANNNAQRAAVDQVVLKNLQDIGVKASIKVIDQAQVTDMLTNGTYDIFLYGGGNYVVDPSIDIPILSCKTIFPNGANLPGYCNKDLDALFDQSRATNDATQRMNFFNQAAKIENTDVPMLWIARPQRAFAASSKITGGVQGGEGMNNALLSVQNWTIK
jgi:peptide/nickel transport system substrate-binding protein